MADLPRSTGGPVLTRFGTLVAEVINLNGRDPIKASGLVFHPFAYGIGTLMRLGVRSDRGQILLHVFRRHDDPNFHDHPWNFTTLCLWGRYTDHHPDGTSEIVRAGHRYRRPATHVHRTSASRLAVTLVVTGPKIRQWQLYRPEGYRG